MKQYTETTHRVTVLEEATVKKPLPLRSHADKPILQYDARTAPRFLGHSDNNTALGGGGGGSDNMINCSHPGSAPGSPTKSSALLQNGLTNTGAGSGSAGSIGRVRNGSSGTVHSLQNSVLGEGDADRLLSAREMVRESGVAGGPRFGQLQLYRVGPSKPVVVPPFTALHRTLVQHEVSDPAAANLPLPRNFLQPAGGVFYNSISKQLTPKKREHSTLSQSVNEANESTVEGNEKGLFSPSAKSPLGPRLTSSSERMSRTFSQAFPQVGFASGSHAASGTLSPPGKSSVLRERQQASGNVGNMQAAANASDPYSDSNQGQGQASENVEQNKKPRSEMTAGSAGVRGGVKPLSGSASFNCSQQSRNSSNGGGPPKPGLGGSSSSRLGDPLHASPVVGVRGSDVGGSLAGDGGGGGEVDVESGLPLHTLTASSLLNTRMGTLRKVAGTRALPGTLHFKHSLLEASRPVQGTGGRKKAPALSSHPPDHHPPHPHHHHPHPHHVLRHAADAASHPATQSPADNYHKALMVARGHMAEEDDDDDDVDDDASLPSGERLSGDGSNCDEMGNVDEDDDGIDNLYDDCQNEDGDDSDDYSVTSSLSQASSITVQLPSATSRPSTTQSSRGPSTVVGDDRTLSVTARPVTSSGETIVQPALRRSLFPAIPPTINFVPEGEKVEQLPWEMRKLLKWRMSPITPNVVKAVLRRSNFKITKSDGFFQRRVASQSQRRSGSFSAAYRRHSGSQAKFRFTSGFRLCLKQESNDWLGCFGKHMKAVAFKSIREYQKVNHFPGSFQLGRKDRLWCNLYRMQLSYGKKEFGFFPQTYVLPQDLRHLKRAWEDSSSKQKWIIKPPASARGIGIKVINRMSQIPRRKPVIVQKYLSKPLLINNSKFDMRVYVYVSCFDPLRVYIFEDGLARFASCKYSAAMKNLGNKFMHLTNYSINKHNADYQSNADDSQCQGHKWSLKSLWSYLEKEGVNTHRIWDSIKDIVVKTLISADASINTMIKANVRSRYTVHELFGFDILLDEQLKPWILEVNISPSLHSSSPLDVSIKGQMVRDMMNLAGFHVPDKNDVVNSFHNAVASVDLSAHVPSSDYCMDKRLFTNHLASDEKAKHAYYCHKWQDEQVLQTMLDVLTPDDVRVLTEVVDEDSRRGGFVRVFPTPLTKRYLRFFQQPRYYNLLLDQWVARYHLMEQRGVSILQSLCEEGIHRENPTSNSSHQWCPPNSAGGVLLSAREAKNVFPLKQDRASLSMPRLPRVRAGLTGESLPIICAPPLPTASSPSPIPRVGRQLDPAR